MTAHLKRDLIYFELLKRKHKLVIDTVVLIRVVVMSFWMCVPGNKKLTIAKTVPSRNRQLLDPNTMFAMIGHSPTRALRREGYTLYYGRI
jgi:hypothetical protein